MRNLEHKKRLTPERVASSDYASSCLLAVGWNIIRSAFPPVITSDWIDFLCANGLPAMDAGVGSASHSGDYSIQYGDDTITFHDAELAPPTGILNHNYSRYTDFILMGIHKADCCFFSERSTLNVSHTPMLSSGSFHVAMGLSMGAISISAHMAYRSSIPQTP